MLTRRGALLGLAALTLSRRSFAATIDDVRPRSDWGAAPATLGGRPHVVRHIALHHTAGACVGTEKAAATLRGIQRFHQRDKGWIDLAYHLFVDADGVVWEGRDRALAGDTATNYDPGGYLLICALGNFEEVEPSEPQVEGVVRILRACAGAYALPVALAMHRELASTLCPGKHLAARVPAIVERARAR